MMLRIGDLSKATNTSPETVRFYERLDLLPKPTRTAGNFRTYGEAALKRLSFIRQARDLGFSLEQVREILSVIDNDAYNTEEVKSIFENYIQEIDRKISDLMLIRDELNQATKLKFS